MKTVSLVITFLLAGSSLLAQPYVSGGNTRFRFAQTYLGLDMQGIPSGGQFAYQTADGRSVSAALPTKLYPRLIIGGLHFWGHADFYVSFPLANLTRNPLDKPTADYSTNIETGARVYPWRLEAGKVRPFVGISLNTTSFQKFTPGQERTAPSVSRTIVPLQAGLAVATKHLMVETGAAFHSQNSFGYYLDRTTTSVVTLPSTWFWLGIKYYFDTTEDNETDYEQTKRNEKRLSKRNRLSGLSLGIGPSTAFFMRQSPYNQETRPYLQGHYGTGVFADLGIGYYDEPHQLHVNVAYRKTSSEKLAYDTRQTLTRQAFTLEAFKFLGDYNGFVPFIGPTLGIENLRVDEQDNVTNANGTHTRTALKPGIIFGWDIRPTKLQNFILRTNLRYTPNLNVVMPTGKAVAFDQLEFNFIQVVWYPMLNRNVRRGLNELN